MKGFSKLLAAAAAAALPGCESVGAEPMLGISLLLCAAVAAAPFILRRKQEKVQSISHHSQIASDPLPELRFCPSCGTPVPRSYLPNACASCGAVFDITWLERLPR